MTQADIGECQLPGSEFKSGSELGSELILGSELGSELKIWIWAYNLDLDSDLKLFWDLNSDLSFFRRKRI